MADDFINLVISDEEYQAKTQEMPNGATVTHADQYSPDYAERAYHYLQTDGASIHGLVMHLQVGKRTLDSWRRRHREFDEAILNGLEVAKSVVATTAFGMVAKPQKETNIAALKFYGAMLGIKESDPQQINITASAVANPAAETEDLYREALEEEQSGGG